MQRFIQFFIILPVIIVGLSGCWVKVSQETEGFMPQEEQKVIPTYIQTFETFKSACENGDWGTAYNQLSSRWRASRSLDDFQKNMQEVGKAHLAGARVITVAKTYNNGIEIWSLTVINNEKDRTMFVLVSEGNESKIDGVRNLP